MPTVDPHIPDLLVFPTGSDLHAHPMVLNGSLILQVRGAVCCVWSCVCVLWWCWVAVRVCMVLTAACMWVA